MNGQGLASGNLRQPRGNSGNLEEPAVGRPRVKTCKQGSNKAFWRGLLVKLVFFILAARKELTVVDFFNKVVVLLEFETQVVILCVVSEGQNHQV